MSQNYKLNYNQYKHLVDVYNTGDFLNESLDRSFELIFNNDKFNVKYSDLVLDDNILYWTQNTRRTFKIPLGYDKVTKSLKMIDLYNVTGSLKISENLKGDYKLLTLLYLLQSYKPDEYEVYCENLPDCFSSLEGFYSVNSIEDIKSLYTETVEQRHRKYLEDETCSFKEYRKRNIKSTERAILFILDSSNFIDYVMRICGGSRRYGIFVLCIDSNTVSSTNYKNIIIPDISTKVVMDEIVTFKKLKKKVILMNRVLDKNILLIDKETFGRADEVLLVKSNDSDTVETCKTGILSTFGDGYRYGFIDSEPHYSSFEHSLFRFTRNLDIDTVQYLVKASIHTLFNVYSPDLTKVLNGCSRLSGQDEQTLNEFIARQVDCYRKYVDTCKISFNYGELHYPDKCLYKTFFCSLYIKNDNLYFAMNNKIKKLSRGILFLMERFNSQSSITIDLIIGNELYEEFGVILPEYLRCELPYSFSSKEYVNQHDIYPDQNQDSLYELIKTYVDALPGNQDSYIRGYLEDKSYKNLQTCLEALYDCRQEDYLKSMINYWLYHKDEFDEVFTRFINSSGLDINHQNSFTK